MGKPEQTDDQRKYVLVGPVGPTGSYPDGKLDKHDKGEIQIAIAAEDKQVLIIFGTPTSWIGLPSGQARKMAVALMTQANKVDPEDFIRVEGGCICELCGDTYRGQVKG